MEFHRPRNGGLNFDTAPSMIPTLNENGLLPEGIHECTLAEAEARFGRFQTTDRRPQLWSRFMEFVREAKASGMVEAVLVDGSFVTAQPAPNDIDLVVVVSPAHDVAADLLPHQYNVLAQQRVRRRFGFDIVVAKNGTDNLAQAVEFFSQVRQQLGQKKGLLKVTI